MLAERTKRDGGVCLSFYTWVNMEKTEEEEEGNISAVFDPRAQSTAHR